MLHLKNQYNVKIQENIALRLLEQPYISDKKNKDLFCVNKLTLKELPNFHYYN
jgi:hypothetical protein